MKTDYDSILTAQPVTPINSTEYYKVGKGLPDHTVSMAEHPYRAAGDDWLMGGALVMCLILSVVLYRNRDTFLYRVKEFLSSKRSYSAENVNEHTNQAYSILLLTSVGALSLSAMLFSYLAKKVGFYEVLGIPYWLLVGGYTVFMLFVYVKAWIYQIVNWTFFDHESNVKWMSGYLILTSFLAYLIFPLALVDILVEGSREIVIWGMIFVFFLYELMLLFKLFVNFESKKYGYLLIFLYFCSVEMMSAIVMSRILVWTMDNFIVKILY